MPTRSIGAGDILVQDIALGVSYNCHSIFVFSHVSICRCCPTAPHFFSRPILIQLYCVIGDIWLSSRVLAIVCSAFDDNAQASHDNHRLTQFMRDNYTKRGAGSNTIDVTPESSRQGATPRVDFGDKPLNGGSTGRSTGTADQAGARSREPARATAPPILASARNGHVDRTARGTGLPLRRSPTWRGNSIRC